MLTRGFIGAALLAGMPAAALEIRSYSAAAHDRFTGTMAAPANNPSQLYAPLDLSGVGWFAANADVGFTLVSRQHVLFATHFSPVIGNNPIRFLSASGQLVTRSLTSQRTTITEGGNPTDLTLIQLSSPIDADAAVGPLPYLDLASGPLYTGQVIGIVGQGPVTGGIPVIGRDTLDAVELLPRSLDYGTESSPLVLTTRYARFDFLPTGTADEGKLEVGDSGSPTFVQANGRAALVGIHSYTEFVDGPGPNDVFQNYDTFLPHYIGRLDALLAPLGYRMRPVNAPATSLSGASSTLEATPRRLKPLTLEFDLVNTGANLTGNLEVEFGFPAGQQPDSVSAAGWVSHGGGGKWTLRKATLASGAAQTLSAHWATAPALASIAPTLTWRSDTVADQTASPVIALAPSYAEWADGLADPGEGSDPDGDGLANLLEYAIGGDPTSGFPLNANGGALTPVLSPDGVDVKLVFPERDDKVLRGLSYTVLYSEDLVTWTATPPAGTSTVTGPFSPVLAGFVERTVTWPADAPQRFARLQVELAE